MEKRMAVMTAKSSTVFIAAGEKQTLIYRSIEDVPAALQGQLKDSTSGKNSATILIADKRGREELVRALQGQPSQVHCRLADTIRSRQGAEVTSNAKKRFYPGSLRTWLEFLIPVAVGASLWFLIGSRF